MENGSWKKAARSDAVIVIFAADLKPHCAKFHQKSDILKVENTKNYPLSKDLASLMRKLLKTV